MSHIPILRKPKNASELLDVENSHSTGAKPTKRRAVIERNVRIRPMTCWTLACIPTKAPKIYKLGRQIIPLKSTPPTTFAGAAQS